MMLESRLQHSPSASRTGRSSAAMRAPLAPMAALQRLFHLQPVGESCHGAGISRVGVSSPSVLCINLLLSFKPMVFFSRHGCCSRGGKYRHLSVMILVPARLLSLFSYVQSMSSSVLQCFGLFHRTSPSCTLLQLSSRARCGSILVLLAAALSAASELTLSVLEEFIILHTCHSLCYLLRCC